MDFIGLVVELFTNADHFLVSLATNYGTWIYAAMFVIFFLETAFVVMSFLPGDSLLFVAGTVAAAGTARPELIMLAVIRHRREFDRLRPGEMAREQDLRR